MHLENVSISRGGVSLVFCLTTDQTTKYRLFYWKNKKSFVCVCVFDINTARSLFHVGFWSESLVARLFSKMQVFFYIFLLCIKSQIKSIFIKYNM